METFFAIVWKEMVQKANRKRFAALKMIAVLGACAVFAAVSYAAVYNRPGSGFRQMSEFGLMMFFAGTAAMALLLSLMAMGIGSNMLMSEKTQRRLPLLLVTPLSSAEIVGSKGAGVVTEALLYVVLALPVAAMVVLFGGVSARMIVAGALFVASNVMLYASIGLAASSACRGVNGASGLAFSLAVVWNVVPFLPSVFAEVTKKALSPGVIEFLWPMSGAMSYRSLALGGNNIYYHLAINLAGTAAFLGVAIRRFRPVALAVLSGEPARSKPAVETSRRGGKAKTRKMARRSRWRLSNPGMLSKEMPFWRISRFAPSFIWFVVVWGYTLWWVGQRHFQSAEQLRDVSYSMLLAEAAGVFILIALSASSRVTGERERGTFEILALTGLGARKILWGKATAAVLEQAPAVAVLLVHSLVNVALFQRRLVPALFTLAAVPTAVVYAAVLGTYYSLAARRSNESSMLTIVSMMGAPLVGLVPFVWLMLSPWQWVNPFVATVTVLVVYGLFLAGVFDCARRRRAGIIAALASYVALSSLVVVPVVMVSTGTVSKGGSILLSVSLPVAGLVPWEGFRAGAMLYCALPTQVVMVAWMVMLSQRSFEGQVTRP